MRRIVVVALSALLTLAALPLSASANSLYLPVVGRNYSESVPPQTWTDLLTNGGFEDGLTGWLASSESGHDILSALVGYDGTVALLGGNSEDTLAQDVTIPSGVSPVHLRFALGVVATSASDGGTLSAVLLSTEGDLLEELGTYEASSVSVRWMGCYSPDLSRYAGQTVRVQLQTMPDSQAVFAVDNVSLTVPAQ